MLKNIELTEQKGHDIIEDNQEQSDKQMAIEQANNSSYNQIKLENELLRKEIEIQKKDHEIELLREKNELQKKDHEIELLKKDLENAELKALIKDSQHSNEASTELSAVKVDEDIEEFINSEEPDQNCSPLGEIDNVTDFS